MPQQVSINVEINLEEVRKTIESAKDLNDNAEFFGTMAGIAKVKKQLEDAADLFKSVENDVKGIINGKAKALYGDDWSAIAGDGYKISRSKTGSLYTVDDVDAAKAFIKVEVKPDGDKIKEHIKANDGKLPKGLGYNPDRGEQIRITVK